MTIIGAGSGRCGTQSLAKMLDAVHEPGPRGPKYKWPEMSPAKRARYIRRHWKPLVKQNIPFVDARCAIELPRIEQLWPKAQIIAVFRDPVQTVESMLAIWPSDPKVEDVTRCINVWQDAYRNLLDSALRVEWYSMYELETNIDTYRQDGHRYVPVKLGPDVKLHVFKETVFIYREVLAAYQLQEERYLLYGKPQEDHNT
jgi:hypothetical protein